MHVDEMSKMWRNDERKMSEDRIRKIYENMDKLWNKVYKIDMEIDLYAKKRYLERAKVEYEILEYQVELIEIRLEGIKARGE